MVGAEYSDGLNQLEWAQLRNEFEMNGGEMNPHLQEMLTKANEWQRLVINQMKLAKRK